MNKKILLIEDLPVIQDLYGNYLKSNGFLVDTAVDGKVALAKVKETNYDFVLVDLLLPTVNGIEFLEKFSPRPPGTKVLVLSDFNEAKTVARANELGIVAYLIKAENTPSQLVEVLNKLSKDSPDTTEPTAG